MVCSSFKANLMKRVFTLLLFMSIISCKKQSAGVGSIMLAQNVGWSVTDFKTGYTIQFPADYIGAGKQGFEGNVFSKKKEDNSIAFSYSYCTELGCHDFGDTLSPSFPNSINIGILDSSFILNKRVSFADSNSLETAILYYNNEDNNSHARLFWKDNGTFKQALEITFSYSGLQEVFDIVRTIKENKTAADKKKYDLTVLYRY